MIELTKKQFDSFLGNTQMTSHLTDIIITRQIVKPIATNRIATGMVLNDFAGIFVYTETNFRYATPTMNTAYARYAPGIATTVNIDENSNNIILNSEMAIQPMYVVYFLKNSSIDSSSLFAEVDLVSVEYVGETVRELSFTSNYSNLEEINLYPTGRYGITGLYSGISIEDGQNIYDGVQFSNGDSGYTYNKFHFAAGAFKGSKIKKLVLPAMPPTIPDELCADCTDLLEVVCEGSLNNIGKNAFKGCTNLQSFYVNAGVSNIEEGAFDGCVNLQDIHMATGSTFFGIRGCIMKKELIEGSTKLSIFFANNYWWDGVENNILECGYVQSGVADTDNKLYPLTITPNILRPKVNMIYTEGDGNIVMDDIMNGSNYGTSTGILVTPSNIDQITSSLTNPPNVVTNRFLIPLCWFVDEIMPNACAGDTTITSVDLSNFFCLTSIGNGAFKGCTGITEIIFGEETHGELNIGVSAFEKCTGFNTLNFTRRFTLSDKSFFGCSALEYLNFNSFSSAMANSSNPSLVFGNTPSLQSITGALGGQIAYYNGTPLNAILATNQSGTSADRILVGCKTTDFEAIRTQYSCTKIGAGAFYGCTSLEINNNRQMLSGYTQVFDSGFYGCTGIVSTNNAKVYFATLANIGPNAFYGCTNIQTLDFTIGGGGANIQIGTKAFANSGVKNITVGTEPYIQSIADDAFENCVLSNVTVGNINGSILRDSNTDVENALLKRTSSGSANVALLKSGDGKEIVNTVYDDKPIVEIKSNAFTGVTMANGNNTEIHIPSSVGTIGKTIMSNTKLNASNGLGTLLLDGDISQRESCPQCDATSIGLLYAVGGKYFKSLVEKTMDNRTSGKTYYAVQERQDEIALDLYEYTDGDDNGTLVLSVYYDADNNMALLIYAIPNYNYAASDNDSHVTELLSPVKLTLMYYMQAYNGEEQGVYCDSELMPGSYWGGIDDFIPEDVGTTSKDEYNSYSSLGNSFANCSWISVVKSSRKLSGLINGFSGCTSLQSINATDSDNHNSVNYPLFDGQVPNGMFSGCTNFTGIAPRALGEKIVYPIEYGDNSYYKCKQLNGNTRESLKLATDFGDESFAETNLTSIDLISALNISATAFKSCNLTSAQANGTGGEFFTGAGGHCIINKSAKIVVGTPAVIIDADCKGIEDYAFYGRTNGSAWGVSPSYKNGFSVGKSAFSESDITQYVETNCTNTSIKEEAFSNCKSLTTVQFTGNNASVTLGKKSYMGCTSLTTLAIPKGTNVPESAFSMCSALTSVTVSGNVDKNAFEKCTSLGTLNFNYDANSIQTIDPSAFKSCPITQFTFTNATTSSYTFTQNTVSHWDSNGHLELVLGTTTFNYSENEMPNFNDLRTIGDHAYNGRGLTGEIIIPGSVTKIGDYAFANNPGITRVFIPTTVEYIGDHAFDGCTNLKRMVLPNKICYIGEGFLKGCNLTEGLNCNYEDYRNLDSSAPQILYDSFPTVPVTFESAIDLSTNPYTSISTLAFKDSKIKVVYLPSGCTSIGASAFEGCAYLSAVHFTNGPSVSLSLGNKTFYGCQCLCDFYLEGSNYPTVTDLDNTFYGVGSSVAPGKKHIHIPNTLNIDRFYNSDFCTQLVALGFTVVVDL